MLKAENINRKNIFQQCLNFSISYNYFLNYDFLTI